MKVRSTIVALSLLALTSAPHAFAATKAKPKPVKPVCKIIVDDAGDAEYNGAVPGDAGDDILSADLASDGKNITAVLRLAALTANNPSAPLGQMFYLEFMPKGGGALLFLSARTFPTGVKFTYGYSGSDPVLPLTTSFAIGDAKGAIDLAAKEVRITAPLAGFAAQGKMTKGTKLDSLTAKSYRIVGQGLAPSQNVGPARAPIGGVSFPFDEATGKSYTVGTPSCVKHVV